MSESFSDSQTSFNSADRAALEQRGISLEEASRQLAFFRTPPSYRQLVRPCTPSDGVLVVEQDWQASFLENFKSAASEGRVTKFVPASGAASRMFKSVAEEEDRLRSELSRFPFAAELEAAAAGSSLGKALVSPDGLDYGKLPKGLIPFHRYGDRVRTPFEEHLVEAAHYARGGNGIARVHFTVSSEHEGLFRDLFKASCSYLEKRLQVTFDLSFSSQSPATDTLAGTAQGNPFRDPEGNLVFRPGGHGALLENLEGLGGDIVVIKNIDNVVPDAQKTDTVRWKQILIGLLVELQQNAFRFILALNETPTDPDTLEKANLLVENLRGAPAKTVTAESIIHLLARPIRVCGVVRNEGEPGGGPFWVRDALGESKQIVESSEVDLSDPDQRAVWESSTHFNPVDLVVGLRDPLGRPYPLSAFTDPQAVFVSHKSHQGKDLLALERPGLWNGAMAKWNTVFVEVPLTTFAPVKTVFDLLRPQHQPQTAE